MPAKIAVITYSTWGHVDKLAQSVEEGLKSTGAIVSRLQLPETLSPDVLAKMHAAPKPSHPILTDPNLLKDFDGFLFGFPTRYGRAPAQVSALFDMTGGLWQTAALYGKFAGVFTSAASQHGGHETTVLTTLPFFAHQGIIFVPLGFTNPHLTDNNDVIGGSAWGTSTIVGPDGGRQPNAKELEIAVAQGKSFGAIVNQYVAGK